MSLIYCDCMTDADGATILNLICTCGETCNYCGSKEMVFNTLVLDSKCQDCGLWTNGKDN
jgi:hypothetical protein